MPIWSAEIKEIERLYESFKGQLPELEKELERLLKTDDENIILVYSRRCLEVIITDLCECELKRPRKTEPLKGIIDKLNREEIVTSHIIASMYSLNSLSTFGAHPKDFDPQQAKPVLNNLDIIIKWYLKYKDLPIAGKTTEVKPEHKQQTITAPEKSIIVLPFENISPDPDQEYFSDGLTEEIITDLSHIHSLRVISRNSAMIFKGSRKPTTSIGKELNVQYLLEGSVRKAGNQLRITAQLIDAISDKHLWAEKYEGTLENIFEIQEQVSRAIVESLRLRLTDKEDKLISTRAIEDVQAYECHLRAIYNIWLTTEEALERALQYINSGLNIIGENEILYADKGQVYIHYVDFVVGKDEIYLKKAEQCVQEIFALNPNSARGHFLNGLIIRNRGKPQEAVKEFKKAIELNPDDPNFLTWLSWVYGHSGHCDAARLLSDRLLVIDPLSPLGHMGTTDLFEGKFKTAANSFKKCNQLEEGNPFYRFWYAKALAYGRSIDEAIEIFELIFEETPDTIWAQLSVFFIKALQNKKNEALESIAKETMQIFRNDEMFPIWMAESYALINEKDEATKWLEHGVNWGFINYPFLNEYDPFLENIRGEERFKKLMERVKYEWENFEV